MLRLIMIWQETWIGEKDKDANLFLKVVIIIKEIIQSFNINKLVVLMIIKELVYKV